MDAYTRWLSNYQRRYIKTGSGAPVFHAMGLIFATGILVHARANRARRLDPLYVPEH